MRGASSGDSRGLNNALETINAAATAIAFGESRAPQPSVRVNLYICIYIVFDL